MKISLDWISQYVDIADLEPANIADRLTMATAEVEGIEAINRSIKGILIGEIVAVDVIDRQRNVNLVTVNCGKKQFKTIFKRAR